MVGVVKDLESGALSRNGMLSVFENARDQGAFDGIVSKLAPHERARLQEQQDLTDDQAGRSNGRSARGGYAHSRNAVEAQRQRAQRAEAMTLAHLMLDATYRALHETAMTTLHDAEREIDRAITQLTDARSALLAEIADVEANALRTADGEIVFMDGDQYRYANGSLVAPEDAATIVPKEGVEYLTYTEYAAMNDRADDMLQHIAALADMRDTRLLEIRDELGAEVSPAQAERVQALTEELKGIADNAREATHVQEANVTLDVEAIKPDTSAFPVIP